MGRYFGTDGFRGVVNTTLTGQKAFLIGQYLGTVFSRTIDNKIVIGWDTRLSGEMLAYALASGAAGCGCEVYLLGVCPTPAVSYLTKARKCSCGVMVTASHNPYTDNGIKIFSAAGTKISEELEGEIEDYMDGISSISLPAGDYIGRIIPYSQEGLDQYLAFLRKEVPLDLTGVRIALDLANGATTKTAERFLRSLGAYCQSIGNNPDGLNINKDCGSTHPENLVKLVSEGSFHCGFAFDGDGDRLIAVDEKGELMDGDCTLYICGKYLRDIDQLNQATIVTTVMANLGLHKALEAEMISTLSTQVGDKYVYSKMVEENYDLGGEQSGHIIFRRHLNTGDGLLTALKLLEVQSKTGTPFSKLHQPLFIYPQLLKNVKVRDKQAICENTGLLDQIKEIEARLEGEGRILVRPSGTEPLVRVMAEARSAELCQQCVDEICTYIEEHFPE
ncbi:MAG: phosphoglucosamine mutase [Erysipelotrichaceae bacterium]|jgi:phosphoglucosamine mutase|nr:phosphoglucosamine mutase [Erysipelotrichaceae bacterium]